MLGHVIFLNGNPKPEWKQFEAQLSERYFHVHIDQVSCDCSDCSYPPLNMPDTSVVHHTGVYQNANAMHAHRLDPRLCLCAYRNRFTSMGLIVPLKQVLLPTLLVRA